MGKLKLAAMRVLHLFTGHDDFVVENEKGDFRTECASCGKIWIYE